MSHRTDALPPLSGARYYLRELRYHEATRQSSGFVFVIVASLLGRPGTLVWGLGLPLVVLGTWVRLWASGFVMKNEELATNGPYSLVRHPLYSGNILVLIGFALGCGLWWPWLVLLVMLWLFYPAAVDYEDNKLHQLFGEAWEPWRERTPALVPRFRRARASDGRWSFRKSLRQNGEPVIAAVVTGLYLYLLWKAI